MKTVFTECNTVRYMIFDLSSPIKLYYYVIIIIIMLLLYTMLWLSNLFLTFFNIDTGVAYSNSKLNRLIIPGLYRYILLLSCSVPIGYNGTNALS